MSIKYLIHVVFLCIIVTLAGQETKNGAVRNNVFNNKLYFCTVADKEHFDWLLNLIGSIHKTNFDNLQEIAVFDIGFTQEQKNTLEQIQKVQRYDIEMTHKDLTKKFQTNFQGKEVRGWFAWKPVAIKQALDKFPYILYLDAGCVVLKPLNDLFIHIQQKGYFLLQDQPWWISMYDESGKNISGLKQFTLRDHCTQHLIKTFDLESPQNNKMLDLPCMYAAIQGLTHNVYESFVMPMYETTKDLRNYQDDGSALWGFGWARHDQTVYTIHARSLGLDLTLTQTPVKLSCGEKTVSFMFADNAAKDPHIFYACKGALSFANDIKIK